MRHPQFVSRNNTTFTFHVDDVKGFALKQAQHHAERMRFYLEERLKTIKDLQLTGIEITGDPTLSMHATGGPSVELNQTKRRAVEAANEKYEDHKQSFLEYSAFAIGCGSMIDNNEDNIQLATDQIIWLGMVIGD